MVETCSVCGNVFPQDCGIELTMFDEQQKVYTDDEPYHLGCGDEIVDEVICKKDA